MADTCFSNPALPVTVPAGGPGHSGFSPSDAALVHAGQNASEARDGVISSWANGKENAIQTLEAKFQAERSFKHLELSVEKTVSRMQGEMAALRAELSLKASDEGNRTRELMRDQEASRVAAAAQASQFKALADAIAKIKPGTVPAVD